MKTRIPGPAAVLAETERALRSNPCVALCHIVRTEGSTPGKPGWRLLVRPDGTTFGNLGGGAFEALVTADARSRLEVEERPEAASEVKRYYLTERAVRGEPTGMVCGGLAEVFLEILEAPPLLVICGGGPVGQAVAHAAAPAGFDLVVADDRADFRRPELFPEATTIVAVDREYRGADAGQDGEDWLAPWRSRSLFVTVVSRCWETDTAALASLLREPLPHLAYLGLMGSRRKIERVKAELADRGLDLEGLPFHAPIGLPLGGDTPGEIAVAITAELIQARYGTQANEQDHGSPQVPALAGVGSIGA